MNAIDQDNINRWLGGAAKLHYHLPSFPKGFWVSSPNPISTTTTVVPANIGQHTANNAVYRVKIVGTAQKVTYRDDTCVQDEDYSNEGLRPIKSVTRMAYVYPTEIIGRISSMNGKFDW
jgi:hypothetical protein